MFFLRLYYILLITLQLILSVKRVVTLSPKNVIVITNTFLNITSGGNVLHFENDDDKILKYSSLPINNIQDSYKFYAKIRYHINKISEDIKSYNGTLRCKNSVRDILCAKKKSYDEGYIFYMTNTSNGCELFEFNFTQNTIKWINSSDDNHPTYKISLIEQNVIFVKTNPNSQSLTTDLTINRLSDYFISITNLSYKISNINYKIKFKIDKDTEMTIDSLSYFLSNENDNLDINLVNVVMPNLQENIYAVNKTLTKNADIYFKIKKNRQLVQLFKINKFCIIGYAMINDVCKINCTSPTSYTNNLIQGITYEKNKIISEGQSISANLNNIILTCITNAVINRTSNNNSKIRCTNGVLSISDPVCVCQTNYTKNNSYQCAPDCHVPNYESMLIKEIYLQSNSQNSKDIKHMGDYITLNTENIHVACIQNSHFADEINTTKEIRCDDNDTFSTKIGSCVCNTHFSKKQNRCAPDCQVPEYESMLIEEITIQNSIGKKEKKNSGDYIPANINSIQIRCIQNSHVENNSNKNSLTKQIEACGDDHVFSTVISSCECNSLYILKENTCVKNKKIIYIIIGCVLGFVFLLCLVAAGLLFLRKYKRKNRLKKNISGKLNEITDNENGETDINI